uniref:FadR family transcriptional regulator n=1 Tax=Geoglobus ahangari TaxID=113653 RepID=A0A7C4S5E6_9EURY
MFEPITNERKPIYIQILEVLRSSILSGKLRPGEKLPPERELAKLLNVSRTSVREALKLLAAQGLVKIVHGQGVFIVNADDSDYLVKKLLDFKMTDVETIKDIMEIRRALEVKAAEWAAKRASEEQRTQLKELIEVTKEKISGKNKGILLILIDHDNKFHKLVAESTGNMIIERLMSNLLEFLFEIRSYTLKIKGRPIKSLNEHEKIANAIINQDPESASKYMEEHLRSVEIDILNKVLKNARK